MPAGQCYPMLLPTAIVLKDRLPSHRLTQMLMLTYTEKHGGRHGL